MLATSEGDVVSFGAVLERKEHSFWMEAMIDHPLFQQTNKNDGAKQAKQTNKNKTKQNQTKPNQPTNKQTNAQTKNKQTHKHYPI